MTGRGDPGRGETSPTARALRALEILQSHPGATAAELADRLGVTDRAARRYVAILREAGYEVESVRGPYGGYRLARGTRLPPVVFTQTEALSLVMAVLDGEPAAVDADDPVGAALSKVVRALPESVGRQAAALRAHASAARYRHSTRPDPATTSALVAAVAARVGVQLTYQGGSGSPWQADVDPWAVVVRYGRWYLLCRCHRAQAIRTYRVDRVSQVQQTGQRFEPPPDLDPVAVLEENLGAGWEFTTRVLFDAPPDQVAPWIRAPMGRLEATQEGEGAGCVLTGTTSNPAMYAQEWLSTVPFAFRVEGGPELRAAVAALAARFGAAVADPP